ncbi:hypothetical protein BEN71_07055 [Acinetobacter wuhouensis]|uniref:hypothetical protein n=1 Tax=Acinetobacter wuhouensis TaxID=1879050 RepID=UPI000E32F482|nr:hypothetical protein [Acinetobacter wuhouensis]AXQ21835.1 hypothetical protein BEN71_07055 [Acinetobacter wuhouensis]
MAAASLGRLTLDLAVKLGSYEQGMTQAERKTKQTTDNMNKAFAGFKNQVADALGGTQLGSLVDSFNTKIGSLSGGIGVASAALAGMVAGGTVLAVASLSKMAIETAKANNELQVLANRANTSIGSFQVLQYAAEGLGVSQDQLGSILADVQEKLGEFSATKGGGAADFFDALKNNTKMTESQIKSFGKTLQGKDGIEAIQMLNNKMDELGVTSQERRFIFESLASDLANLAPIFAENGKALDAFDLALQQAGLKTTKEAAEQSQLLAAQVKAVNLQFQGWKNQLVSGFMPAIIDVANAFFSTSKNGQQLQSVGAGIGSVMKAVAKVALGVSAAFTIAGKVIGGVAAAIAALKGDKIATVNMMFDDIEQTLADYGNRIDSFSIIGDSATKSTNDLVNAILDVNSAAQQSAKGLALDTKAADENAKATEKQAAAKTKVAKEQENLNKMVGASALSGLRIKSSEAFAGGQVRGYTANFAQMAQKQLGSDLNRFTAFNDLYHKGTNSKHATGNAFDFTIADASKSTQAVKQLEDVAKRYGYVVKVLDEYRNPSSRATGGHLHVSVLGFKGNAEAAKQAQDELGLIAKTNEEADRIREESQRAQQSVIRQYLTEREKLEVEHGDKLLDIKIAFAGDQSAIKKYSDLQNAAYQKDVTEYQEAQKQKELSDKKQLLEAKRHWISTEDYAKEYYALVREEILNTAEYSPEMKNALVKQANIQQGVEENSKREQVWSDYQSMMGLEKSPYQQDIDLLAEARKHMLLTEEEYQQQRLAMQMSYGAQYGADFAGMMMGLVDSSSSAYAILGSVQKGFALFSTAMNSYQAISAAWASAPFPYNLPAVGIATMETGLLQAAVSALSPVGYATGGFTGFGGKYEPAGIVHKGEGVLTQEEIAALGGPAGFYALRDSIRNGFADGGLALDAPKLINAQSPTISGYMEEAQQKQQANLQHLQINNILDPSIVGDFMGTSSGTKTFMNFIKNNRSSIKAMIA